MFAVSCTAGHGVPTCVDAGLVLEPAQGVEGLAEPANQGVWLPAGASLGLAAPLGPQVEVELFRRNQDDDSQEEQAMRQVCGASYTLGNKLPGTFPTPPDPSSPFRPWLPARRTPPALKAAEASRLGTGGPVLFRVSALQPYS